MNFATGLRRAFLNQSNRAYLVNLQDLGLRSPSICPIEVDKKHSFLSHTPTPVVTWLPFAALHVALLSTDYCSADLQASTAMTDCALASPGYQQLLHKEIEGFPPV